MSSLPACLATEPSSFVVSEEDRTIPHSGGFFLYNLIIPRLVLFQTKEAKKGNLRKGSKGCRLRIE